MNDKRFKRGTKQRTLTVGKDHWTIGLQFNQIGFTKEEISLFVCFETVESKLETSFTTVLLLPTVSVL